MNSDNFEVLQNKLAALKVFIANVATLGRSLPDNKTADQYRDIYNDIKGMLNDPNLKIYAPNISTWASFGGSGLLSHSHQVEILNSGTKLIKYVEAVLDSQSPESSNKHSATVNIFISHGKESKALELVTKFVASIGLNPVVVMEQPSRGMSVDDKVIAYMATCKASIILATGDDSVGSTLQPRPNVIHEIGIAQQLFNDKIVYLLEEGTEFPSNISPKVYERFTQDNVSKAFIAIARDLKSFDIL